MHGFVDLLDAADVDELVALGGPRRVPPGRVLFCQGEPGREALVLLHGEVKITGASTAGHEVVVTVLGPGALVGELALIDGGVRSATATALTPVEAIGVPAERFLDFLERRPRIMRELLVSLALKLRETTHRQLEIGTADALGRTCGRLVEVADRWGERSGDDTVVCSPVNQSDLATWAGLSREAVVKALRTLRRLGWVENRGRHIVIHDVAALRTRADATWHPDGDDGPGVAPRN